MAIATTVKTGATAIAATGGDDTVVTSLGISNGLNSAFLSTDVDLVTRRRLEFSAKQSAPSNGPGGFSFTRNGVILRDPFTTSSGDRVINTYRFEVARHPEVDAARVEANLELMAQFIGTAAFMSFYKDLNLN